MELGDLKDSLLNMGKEKGKELGDNLLGERQDEGGVLGTAAGYGKDLFDREFGGAESADAPADDAPSAEDAGDNSEDSSSDDSNDDDGQDDNK